MAAAIRDSHPTADVQLIAGGCGDFIVVVDGRQIWHKRQMGDEFPEHGAILKEL